ncbi:MAG: tRNA guanosine(15) transglycosylase TgtA [Euryarchaeota archaeon]|jgi:7-cyano-7-deazaguanine tRNA-ribosyltransferase|nr:tRNA guanosine(15) transglycosylase TgtA [Euryarchaeota archaeon]MBT5184262.1 tRNA guanosine(15) transglycosylase TgtA [Euryarchaeota archaeon]
MKWQDGRRDGPAKCREKDLGRFEIYGRDGQARLGKLHTAHGVLETPCLLPVINPNIRTIEPREMWDKYGIQALITNSYVIWKHENLKEEALKEGVHSLIDFPGVIMTDSGTFQSYVYGDVEVGVEEIVQFQKDIGVDIATMLDIFTRPDMTFAQVEKAVDETIRRSDISIKTANETMLNGPIQGGLFPELRSKSARGMGALDFSIHPIGGIVPIMEQQKYRDLAKIMLACKSNLPPNKPVHMFGCGHPMLFPMLVAMGADLFDSAAYVLFARDGRLLMPWGTEKISNIEEWPIIMPAIANITPAEVRAMKKQERTVILSKYNLEITLQEMSRCRQAIRDGTIWRLAERRSHQHPALREAFLWLVTNPARSSMEPIIMDEVSAAKEIGTERGKWEENWDWLVNAQTTPRNGSESWGGQDTHHRPHIEMARKRLFSRWKSRKSGDVVIFHGASAPWRERIGELVDRIWSTDFELFVQTPLGLVPWGLEDLNPWAHIEGPDWLWKRKPNFAAIQRELGMFGIHNRRIIPVDISDTEELHSRVFKQLGIEPKERTPIEKLQAQVVDKLCVLCNVDQDDAIGICEDATFVMSRTGRIRNVIDASESHLFSPRLAEGGISLTVDGARVLHALRKVPAPIGFNSADKSLYPGNGPAWVIIDDDAEPFVREGRNVMHGFILACDSWIRPDESVLIVNSSGELVAIGRSQATSGEMESFTKGIAVKVREGCP